MLMTKLIMGVETCNKGKSTVSSPLFGVDSCVRLTSNVLSTHPTAGVQETVRISLQELSITLKT